MTISLATKTYRRVHFVDSEARVEVGERRYRGTHLKEPVKRDGCIRKDAYPRSSQSSVRCDHTCIIGIEYLMPQIKSSVRHQKVGHVRWTGLHECCRESGEKFLQNTSIDYALAKEDVYVEWSECIHDPNVNGLTRDNMRGVPVDTWVGISTWLSQKIAAYIW